MTEAGWIGVDLDGTLAVYDGWKGSEHIGEPIIPVLKHVKDLLHAGVEVRIFTARVQEGARAIAAIERWCLEHIGQVLTVTDRKDFSMVYGIDDRIVSVQRNTGVFLVEPPSIQSIYDHWNPEKSGAPPKEFKR